MEDDIELDDSETGTPVPQETPETPETIKEDNENATGTSEESEENPYLSM